MLTMLEKFFLAWNSLNVMETLLELYHIKDNTDVTPWTMTYRILYDTALPRQGGGSRRHIIKWDPICMRIKKDRRKNRRTEERPLFLE